MAELGYDEHELYKKGRFRPATFWRTDRVVLATAPTHRDRCLITQLRQLPAAPAALEAAPAASAAQPIVHLVNCHLTAGPEPGRRLRQVHDAMDWLRKDLKKRDDLLHPPPPKQKKQKKPKMPKGGDAEKTAAAAAAAAAEPPPAPAPPLPPPRDPRACYDEAVVVVVGDLNADGSESGVGRMLTQGLCEKGFAEDGQVLTTKDKKQDIGPFVDVFEAVYRANGKAAPVTMVCEELIPRLVAPGCDLEADACIVAGSNNQGKGEGEEGKGEGEGGAEGTADDDEFPTDEELAAEVVSSIHLPTPTGILYHRRPTVHHHVHHHPPPSTTT